MGRTLRLLIIEDVEDHALLIVRELRKGGFDPAFERVETLQELEAALESGTWDAIISDFNLPSFNGFEALRTMQEKGLDLPFLLVSGAIGEEKAAEMMKAGAHDYIRKGNYARLAATLERELLNKNIRHERQQSAEELTRHREHLEELVQERTTQLVKANEALQSEIDERKRAEEALRRATQEREQTLLKLEAVLENIGEGVVISDLAGNVLTMNKEALALHQYESTDQARLHISELRETFELSDLQGRSVPFEEWPLARALRGERFVDDEVQVRRKDTGKLWVGSYSGTSVCNKAGEPILAVINLRDITERKRFEEALVRAREEWERTFNSVPDLIAILDDRNRIVRVNRAMAERLGRRADECVGLLCYATIHGMESAPDSCPHSKTLADAGEHEALVLESHLGGSFMVTTTPLATGGINGAVYVARDITERMRAEEENVRLNADLAARVSELEESNQELEAFNRMVSHDLRQPLNTIGLVCQEMDMLCSDQNGICKKSIQVAYNGVLRMNTLIETLLNFSRSTHGNLRPEVFNISDMVKSVVAEVRLTEPDRRVSLEVAEGVTANGDPRLLRAVLENLIGNAWKYTGKREEGVIEFGATEVDGRRAYFVRDNGKGFDMADADKLFIPFQRLHDAEEFKGSGIGLATVERIIRRHGGRIWAEGEPDKGATFYFTLGAPHSKD